jgi:rod shape-determining protein MreC
MAASIWQVLYSPFYEAGEAVKGIYQVHLENKNLREQIANLMVESAVLQEQSLENHRLRDLLGLRSSLGFEVIPAEVTSRDPTFRQISLVINAGSTSGVKRDLAVINPQGLVGKIVDVFPDYSAVQLLFDPGFQVSCVNQRSRVMGIASWKTGLVLEMSYVSLNADIRVGDQVVTSGLSNIYPAGLKIGQVSSVTQDPKMLFKEIELLPHSDLQELEEVFVIKSF